MAANRNAIDANRENEARTRQLLGRPQRLGDVLAIGGEEEASAENEVGVSLNGTLKTMYCDSLAHLCRLCFGIVLAASGRGRGGMSADAEAIGRSGPLTAEQARVLTMKLRLDEFRKHLASGKDFVIVDAPQTGDV